jgi:hypothetical protein
VTRITPVESSQPCKQVRNSACKDHIPNAVLIVTVEQVDKSSSSFFLSKADQVGIMENPPPPPPRFEDAPPPVDRLGAFLLEAAAPLPDAFDPAPLA